MPVLEETSERLAGPGPSEAGAALAAKVSTPEGQVSLEARPRSAAVVGVAALVFRPAVPTPGALEERPLKAATEAREPRATGRQLPAPPLAAVVGVGRRTPVIPRGPTVRPGSSGSRCSRRNHA